MTTLPNNASKRILILASKLGYQTRSFAGAAKKLGVDIVFGTDRCHKLDDPWSDGALALHFEQPQQAAEEIIAQWKGTRPGGVLALGDRPTPTAAYALRAFDLPGNSVKSVEICRNKLLQRQTLRAAGLPVPGFHSFALEENIDRVAAEILFPCVVKPLMLAASQGVMRANDRNELSEAVHRIRALLGSPEIQVTREGGLDRYLVEDYVPGGEVAVEGLLTEGQLRILAIFDKPDPLEGPFFEETIYVTPSRLPESTQRAIAKCAQESIRALGLASGPIHAEFRINDSGPWVLEIAPRPIGGLCSRALRFGKGSEKTSLEELILRHALGLPQSDLPREKSAAGVLMIPVPRSGILERVEGTKGAESVPNIESVEITARLHDYIAAWPEGSSYLGFIFSRAETPERAEEALRAAHARLNFVLTSRLPVEHPVTGRVQR